MAVKTYDKSKDRCVQLSKNFKVREFACKCSRCSIALVDEELVRILQQIRDHFGVSVDINSGYRCKEHNAEVGGDPNSSHMQGMAADIRVKGVAPREVAKFAESIGVKRIGLYEGDEGEFVHIGSGVTKRFWLGRKAVLVDTFGDLEFEIASEKVENVQFSVPGETLGYYIIAGGSPKGTVSKYCQLTGMPALPPAWSFGLWLTTSFTTNYDEETTSSFIQGMADRNIPLRVFHFDCYWMRAYRWCDFVWDPDTFPDPAGMLRRYHEKGLQICVWINPYIGQMSHLFKEGKDQGFLVKKGNGVAAGDGPGGLYQSPGGGLVRFQAGSTAGHGRGLLQNGLRRAHSRAGHSLVRWLRSQRHAQPVRPAV